MLDKCLKISLVEMSIRVSFDIEPQRIGRKCRKVAAAENVPILQHVYTINSEQSSLDVCMATCKTLEKMYKLTMI